jgi:hypothetical protein
MEAVRNKQRIAYTYNDGLLGCNYDFNCQGFNISYKKINYDGKFKKLEVDGTVFWNTENRPLPGVSVLVAKPRKGELSKVYKVDSTSKKKDVKEFPYQMGDFSFSVKLRKGYKLYFCHPSFFLVEFDINRLKKLKKYNRT